MTDNTGKLRAKELHLLLDHLHDYLKSDKLCIRAQKSLPDITGNIIHLDGAAFLAGFRAYLETVETEPESLMDELDTLMELSIYIRNGGIKAIMYRLETGSASGINLDIFDNIAAVMSKHWHESKFTPESKSMFQHLQSFHPDDESRVSAIIAELDEFLLELNRRLEEFSLQKLESISGELATEEQ